MWLACSSALASICGARIESFTSSIRLGAGVLFFKDLDDVKAVLGFDEVGRRFRRVEKTPPSRTLERFGLAQSSLDRRPLSLEPGSSEYFLASSSNFAPFFACLRTSSAFFLISATSASVLTHGQQQNVLRVDSIGHLILLDVLLIFQL